MSELMLHTKMCNVKIYVTREYEMCSIRTYVTYENIICPNIMSHTKICLVSKNMSCVMSKPVSHGNMMPCVFPN